MPRASQSHSRAPVLDNAVDFGGSWPPSDGRYSPQQRQLWLAFNGQKPNESIQVVLNPLESRRNTARFYSTSGGSQFLTWTPRSISLLSQHERPCSEFLDLRGPLWRVLMPGIRTCSITAALTGRSAADGGRTGASGSAATEHVHRSSGHSNRRIQCTIDCEDFLEKFRTRPLLEQEDLFFYGLLYTPIFYYYIPLSVLLRLEESTLLALHKLMLLDGHDCDDNDAEDTDIGHVNWILQKISDLLRGDTELERLQECNSINLQDNKAKMRRNRDKIMRTLRDELFKIQFTRQQETIAYVQPNWASIMIRLGVVDGEPDSNPPMTIITYNYGRVDEQGRVEVGTITNDGETLVEPGPPYTPDRLPEYEHPPPYSPFSLQTMVDVPFRAAAKGGE